MSKRSRYLEKPKDSVILCEDVWFIIGSFLPFYEIDSLVNLRCTTRDAIHWIRKPVEQLIEYVMSLTFDDYKKSVPLLLEKESGIFQTWTEKSYNDIAHFHDALSKYRHSKTAHIKREWIGSLFSVISLSFFRARYHTLGFHFNNVHINPEAPVNYIFYKSSPERPCLLECIKSLDFVATAPEMAQERDVLSRSTMNVVRKSSNKQTIELFSAAFDSAWSSEQGIRRMAFLALSETIEIRETRDSDLFRSLVIKPPDESHYSYIYNKENQFIQEFRKNCVYYKGTIEEANIALALFHLRKEHDKRCTTILSRILSEINK